MGNKFELQMTPETCAAIGGKWIANASGTGGTCSFGKQVLTANIEVYRGDPCQQNPDTKGRYILVPYSKDVMTALKNAMKPDR